MTTCLIPVVARPAEMPEYTCVDIEDNDFGCVRTMTTPSTCSMILCHANVCVCLHAMSQARNKHVLMTV